MWKRTICGIFLIILGCAPDGMAPADSKADRSFSKGITGSAPRERDRNPTILLDDPAVRDLVIRVAEELVSVEDGQAALAGSEFALDNLLAAGLLRAENGGLLLALNYLSAEDQRKIDLVGRTYGESLADGIMAQTDALNAAVASLVENGFARADLLYFLIGCVALDWDGLSVTEREGWRAGATVVTEGTAYTPWMKENAPDISRKGLYWGSHNTWVGEFSFTSFGDHHSVPRMTLPDIHFSLSNPYRQAAADEALSGPTMKLFFAYDDKIQEDSLNVIRAIAGGASKPRQIAEATELDEPTLAAHLDLLRALNFVSLDGSHGYRLNVLFLDADAIDAVSAVVAIIRQVMKDWHEKNYDSVRSALGELNAVRRGVPYKVVYTEIWHYLFGHANRLLAERGLIADPYAEGRKFKGFLPVVWNRSIYKG